MIEFSAQAHALLGSDAVAHVWTNNPDGTPQVSVVWMIARGDEILFGTDANSQKARNLRARRPHRVVDRRRRTQRARLSSATWSFVATPPSILDLIRC